MQAHTPSPTVEPRRLVVGLQDLEPEVRTFNTAIIACNMCGQPHEALKVNSRDQVWHCLVEVVPACCCCLTLWKHDYSRVTHMITSARSQRPNTCAVLMDAASLFIAARTACNSWCSWALCACSGCCALPLCPLLVQVYQKLLDAGLQPISTTYTALISAFGKAGQLDKAMETFHTMIQQGCERSVITYSALISACEKSGKWELALELFDKMQQEGCSPNTVTYNSLISACQQGGWGC